MGRTAKQGISFYRMNCGHILNSKVRLVFNEFDSDGYYIWCCLLDKAFLEWGYYFDPSDKDDLDLFASEFCKKKVGLVKEVIAGCIRRDLFDKAVYDSFGILTSEMMQDTFIRATADRRSAGTVMHIHKNHLLVTFKKGVPLNLEIVQPNIEIDQPNNTDDQPNNLQIRLDKNRIDKRIAEKNPTGGAPAGPSPQSGRNNSGEKETEPFWTALKKVWFDFGVERFGVAPSFDGADPRKFKAIIQRLKKHAAEKNVEWNATTGQQRLRYFLDTAYEDEWLCKNFLLGNLEKQFDKINQRQGLAARKAESANKSDLQYLYERYLDGQLNNTLLGPDHYDQLVQRNIVEPLYWQLMITKRVSQLKGTNQGNELRLLQAYLDRKDSPERTADISVLKRIAIMEAFGWLKSQNIVEVPDVVA